MVDTNIFYFVALYIILYVISHLIKFIKWNVTV